MKKNTFLTYFSLIMALITVVFIESCKKKIERSVPIVKTSEVINLQINQQVGSIGANNSAYTEGTAVGEMIDDGESPVLRQGFVWSTIDSVIDIDNYEGTAHGLFVSGNEFFSGKIKLDYFDTTYYLRAFAVNDQGVGYGEILSFETPSFVGPDVITLEPINITGYEALLRGEVLNIGEYGMIYPRETAFCLGTEPNLTVNNSFVSNGSPLQLGIFESEASNLQNSTAYYVRAFVNIGNHIYYGNEVTFTTKGYPVVEITEVTDITSTQASGGGVLIDNGGYEITATGVCWSRSAVFTIGSAEGFTVNNLVNGSFTSLLENLIGDKTYYVSAYATSELGTAYSDVISFRTLDACEGLTEVTDIDGNTYRVVPISGINASQCWMAENLKVTKGPDGSNIQRNCYDNSNVFCQLYGGLYTWHTASNGELSNTNLQGICPDGWRLPNRNDFSYLNSIIGGQNVSGMKLKSCRQVDSPLEGDCNTDEHPKWDAYPLHYGIDEYGFSALPGGFSGNTNYGYELGQRSYYWMSEEVGSDVSYIYMISWDRSEAYRSTMMKRNKLSIRCIKEGATYE